MSRPAIRECQRFDDTAKHKPWAEEMTAALTPITLPDEFTSGPPLFPSLMKHPSVSHRLDESSILRSQCTTQCTDHSTCDGVLQPHRFQWQSPICPGINASGTVKPTV